MRAMYRKMSIKIRSTMMLVMILTLCLALFNSADGSLISSSEIQMCSRTSKNAEPLHPLGRACNKKFVISLAVQNGKVSPLYYILFNYKLTPFCHKN